MYKYCCLILFLIVIYLLFNECDCNVEHLNVGALVRTGLALKTGNAINPKDVESLTSKKNVKPKQQVQNKQIKKK